MAVGFGAGLGLGSSVGSGESVCLFGFSLFPLFRLYSPSGGCRIESRVDTECTVPVFRMLKPSLGSAACLMGT